MAAIDAKPAIVRLGTAQLRRRLGGVSAVTLWRWYTATPPRLPVPHHIGSRKFWFEHEIEEWEREQMARPQKVSRNIQDGRAA